MREGGVGPEEEEEEEEEVHYNYHPDSMIVKHCPTRTLSERPLPKVLEKSSTTSTKFPNHGGYTRFFFRTPLSQVTLLSIAWPRLPCYLGNIVSTLAWAYLTQRPRYYRFLC